MTQFVNISSTTVHRQVEHNGYLYIFTDVGVDIYDVTDLTTRYAYATLSGVVGGDVGDFGVFLATSASGVYHMSFPGPGDATSSLIAKYSTSTSPAIFSNVSTGVAAYSSTKLVVTHSAGVTFVNGADSHYYSSTDACNSPAIDSTNIYYHDVSDETAGVAFHKLAYPTADWERNWVETKYGERKQHLEDFNDTNSPAASPGTNEEWLWGSSPATNTTYTFGSDELDIASNTSSANELSYLRAYYRPDGTKDITLEFDFSDLNVRAENGSWFKFYIYNVGGLLLGCNGDAITKIHPQIYQGSDTYKTAYTLSSTAGKVRIEFTASTLNLKITVTDSVDGERVVLNDTVSPAPAANRYIQIWTNSSATTGTTQGVKLKKLHIGNDLNTDPRAATANEVTPTMASKSATVIRKAGDLFVGTDQGVSIWDGTTFTELDETDFGGSTADTYSIEPSTGATDSTGDLVFSNDDRSGVYNLATSTMDVTTAPTDVAIWYSSLETHMGFGDQLWQMTNAISLPAFTAQGNSAATATFDSVVIGLEMEADAVTAPSLSMDKTAIEISMTGSITSVSNIIGEAKAVGIKMTGTMYTTVTGDGDATVVSISMDAGGYVDSTGEFDSEVILLSMEADLVQDTSNVIPADADDDYPNITGEEYIVVNLRTLSHTTYRDGSRAAMAKTGQLTFGSMTLKALSDAFTHCRATNDLEFVIKAGEKKERIYPFNFGQTTEADLKNRRLPTAKGLKATNWEFSLVSPFDSHLEVRGLDLYITDLKRHT